MRTILALLVAVPIMAQGQGVAAPPLRFSAPLSKSGSTVSFVPTTGTCALTVAGTTAAGTAGYTEQGCTYQVVGNRVHLQARVKWFGHTGTGTILIAGFPVSPALVFQWFEGVAAIGLSNTAGAHVSMNFGSSSFSAADLVQVVAGGAQAGVPISAAGELLINTTYVK